MSLKTTRKFLHNVPLRDFFLTFKQPVLHIYFYIICVISHHKMKIICSLLFPIQTQWEMDLLPVLWKSHRGTEDGQKSTQCNSLHTSSKPISKQMHDEGVWWGCKFRKRMVPHAKIFTETMMQYYRRSVALCCFSFGSYFTKAVRLAERRMSVSFRLVVYLLPF